MRILGFFRQKPAAPRLSEAEVLASVLDSRILRVVEAQIVVLRVR